MLKAWHFCLSSYLSVYVCLSAWYFSHTFWHPFSNCFEIQEGWIHKFWNRLNPILLVFTHTHPSLEKFPRTPMCSALIGGQSHKLVGSLCWTVCALRTTFEKLFTIVKVLPKSQKNSGGRKTVCITVCLPVKTWHNPPRLPSPRKIPKISLDPHVLRPYFLLIAFYWRNSLATKDGRMSQNSLWNQP